MQEGRDEKGRFAKCNLFALGLQNSGRPLKYDDPNVMADKIAEYLDYEDSLKRPDAYSKQGKGIYTLEGCALYLGFASVQSMHDYEDRSTEFSYVINRFKLFLTHWNAQKLYWGGTFQGSNFWLRNWSGYSDRKTLETDSKVDANIKTEQKITVSFGSSPVHAPRESREDSQGDRE